MKILKTITLFLVFYLLTSIDVLSCTSAVITGKATPDGRPLLWKHRDTDYLPNHIAKVKGEKFDFIANVNSENFDTLKEAWIGKNSAGFAIMNTQSYNLVDVKDGEERGAANGSIIYRALEICETIDDFKNLLDTIPKPSLIEANFGVIDANGSAGVFEVDYYNYVFFDANDENVAPDGFITRTNFSVSGKENQGLGYVRFMEADSVIRSLAENNCLTPANIYNQLSRSFHNPALEVDLLGPAFNKDWFIDQDFIPRNITSCSIIIQGGKEGESPETDVMWTILGYPPTGLALPLFLSDEIDLPIVMQKDSDLGSAPMSYYSLQQADEVFGYNGVNGTGKYINLKKLKNDDGTGFIQRLTPIENEIFVLALPLIEKWRKDGKVNHLQLKEFYNRVEKDIAQYYQVP